MIVQTRGYMMTGCWFGDVWTMNLSCYHLLGLHHPNWQTHQMFQTMAQSKWRELSQISHSNWWIFPQFSVNVFHTVSIGFPSQNVSLIGDFPIKYHDFPIKNGEFPQLCYVMLKPPTRWEIKESPWRSRGVLHFQGQAQRTPRRRRRRSSRRWKSRSDQETPWFHRSRYSVYKLYSIDWENGKMMIVVPFIYRYIYIYYTAYLSLVVGKWWMIIDWLSSGNYNDYLDSYCCLVVTGTCFSFLSRNSWKFHHPNWRSHIFSEG